MLTGLKILVVEDNLLNHKIVSFILLKHKAIIKMAMNGREAIDILSADDSYDLVLMDLQMPEMDGYSAIKYIRQELKSSIPIIALTASLLGDEQAECMQLGANACVSKPLDANTIADLIAKLTTEYNKGKLKNQTV